MRRLELDFWKNRPASPWASWVLLAVAIAFAADLGVTYAGLLETVARKEARFARPGGPIEEFRPARTGLPEASAGEIAFARDTIQRLSMPWDNLFGALESTARARIALLAIEPDTKTGTVLISGQAGDYPAVLDYVSELGHAGPLSRVHLVRHELRLNDPRQPVAFTVSASWRRTK